MANTGDLKHVKLQQKIGFIGGGNMAKAIFDGITKNEIVSPQQVFVSGPRDASLEYFKQRNANVTNCNVSVITDADVIFISVKPQMFQCIGSQLISNKNHVDYGSKLFISILAGISLKCIEQFLGTSIRLRLIRLMPNTPISLGEGCSVFARNPFANEVDGELLQTLLSKSGLCLEVPENQIDAMGALAGSGPAFMYLILEAMADGAVKMGVPRATAVKAAAQTMLGAAKMVLLSDKHSAQLKDEVCSAGGTTITGIHALEKNGVRGAIMDAIEAAAKKSAEMNQKTSSN